MRRRLSWMLCLITMSAVGSTRICSDHNPDLCQQSDALACEDPWFARSCCGSCARLSVARSSVCEKDIDISATIAGGYFLIPVRSVGHPKDLAAVWCADHPELELGSCLLEASMAISEVCTVVFEALGSSSGLAAESTMPPGCVNEECSELNSAYYEAAQRPGPIGIGCNDHLPPLHRLASQVRSVAEFGVATGDTSSAILSSWAPSVRSYDLWDWSEQIKLLRFWAEACFEACGVPNWNITFGSAGDTRIVTLDGGVDLLYIDSFHTYWLLRDELARHAPAVRRYIAMHDTTAFGEVDEVFRHQLEADGDRERKNISDSYSGSSTKQGLWPAVSEFLEANAEWSVWFRMHSCAGFTVLRRR